METLFTTELMKLYDVVRRYQMTADTPTLYYHVDCEQGMAVRWPYSSYLNNMHGQGATRCFCPKCGKPIVTRHNGLNIFVCKYSTRVPTHAAFTVKEGKDWLDFSVFMDTITIDTDFDDIYRPSHGRRVTQTIRFNFKEQRTYYLQRVGKTVHKQLLDPCLDTALGELMCLRYIRGCGHLQEKHNVHAITNVAKVLKEAFARKLTAKVGYKVDLGRASVQRTSDDGVFTNLIQQLTWRLTVPDGPVLNERTRKELRELGDTSVVNDIIAGTTKGLPFYKAVIQATGIDDNRLVRYGIQNHLGVTPTAYKIASRLFTKRDFLKAGFMELLKKPMSATYYTNTVTNFLPAVVKAYGERYALSVLKYYDVYGLRDMATMYSLLGPADWERITATYRPRVRNLHDALMDYKEKKEHRNRPIQRGQRYRELEFTSKHNYKFKAPKSSLLMRDIGEAMHNCIAKVYLPRVEKGECAIVAVMKNKKPVACLELRNAPGGRYSILAQARLKNNEKIKKDENVQAAILEWLAARNITDQEFIGR